MVTDIFDYYRQIANTNIRRNNTTTKKEKKKNEEPLIETLADIADYQIKEKSIKENCKILNHYLSLIGIGMHADYFIPHEGESIVAKSQVSGIAYINLIMLALNIMSPKLLKFPTTKEIFQTSNLHFRLKYVACYKPHESLKEFVSTPLLSTINFILRKKMLIQDHKNISFLDRTIYKFLVNEITLQLSPDISITGQDATSSSVLAPQIGSLPGIINLNDHIPEGLYYAITNNSYVTMSISLGIAIRLLDIQDWILPYSYRKKESSKEPTVRYKIFENILSNAFPHNINLHLGNTFSVAIKPFCWQDPNTMASSETWKDPFWSIYYGIAIEMKYITIYLQWGVGVLQLSQLIVRELIDKTIGEDIEFLINIKRICQSTIGFRNQVASSGLFVYFKHY